MLQDDRDHIGVVVSNGHVEGGLHGNATGVLGERLLRLQVWIGPLLKQLCCQACQATATCSMKRALPLNMGKVEQLSIRTSEIRFMGICGPSKVQTNSPNQYCS